MAIDMKKIKERQVSLSTRGGGKDNFWRPQDGEQTIRIVPTPDGDPFKDYWFHYNLDAPAFLSPKKNFGEDDPLDSFVRKLFNEKTEESIRQAKNLMARQRFFSPVVVRGEEDKGVRLWGYGKMVYEQLLNLVLNPEYGDITDPESGTDLLLHYGKPVGASFPQTKITPRRRSSALVEDEDQAAQFLDSVPDFNTVFDRKTSEEVGKILDGFLLGATDAEGNSSETTRYNNNTSDTTTTSGASDVETAFDELLNS
tara:strand:+ start:332 stop:1096 length:765 start_codon:yes stop_codon:yes gene_type:complete